jgi:hypothetical protein
MIVNQTTTPHKAGRSYFPPIHMPRTTRPCVCGRLQTDDFLLHISGAGPITTTATSSHTWTIWRQWDIRDSRHGVPHHTSCCHTCSHFRWWRHRVSHFTPRTFSRPSWRFNNSDIWHITFRLKYLPRDHCINWKRGNVECAVMSAWQYTC